jgi:two-component system LytT family response regulator
MLPEQFIRIHNSYIIPLGDVTAVFKNKVQLGEEFLPIGITYKKKVIETLERHFRKNNA